MFDSSFLDDNSDFDSCDVEPSLENMLSSDMDSDFGEELDQLDPSSVDFQIGGYGGFGYDTCHVKADDPEPEIVRCAIAGDLGRIKDLVNAAKLKGKDGKGNDDSERETRLLLNKTKRWTEVDYKMSGFTKEWEWHGLTALASASLKGHAPTVYFLLMNGADPTLQGCEAENEYYDAYKAGEKCSENSPGKELVNQFLRVVRPFWFAPEYWHAQYTKKRVEKGFDNFPTNGAKMREALRDFCSEAGLDCDGSRMEITRGKQANGERRRSIPAPIPCALGMGSGRGKTSKSGGNWCGVKSVKKPNDKIRSAGTGSKTRLNRNAPVFIPGAKYHRTLGEG